MTKRNIDKLNEAIRSVRNKGMIRRYSIVFMVLGGVSIFAFNLGTEISYGYLGALFYSLFGQPLFDQHADTVEKTLYSEVRRLENEKMIEESKKYTHHSDPTPS
ncbi:hypothetical protein EUZ85_14710 [Hahella sp. KA22]|uniref:hypothetical protein n=1 Tax=Hahella sp. KA22 TaxID=1628392 RepID=UPI000FDD0151|nr:hypothetical protein [Hahella sp. KA22]AZZ91911.1 hypothetical protein ENC22_12145 [Hahella sp. KA22]QAY55282.1 hypothetical protein EUZ85_14710 [Hahella sp. KA22]